MQAGSRGLPHSPRFPSKHMHIPECYKWRTEMHGSRIDKGRGVQSILVLTSKTSTCSVPVRFVTHYPVDASVDISSVPVIHLGSEEEARARFCISVRELCSEMISRVDFRGGLHAIETRTRRGWTALGREMELGDVCMYALYRHYSTTLFSMCQSEAA